MRAVVVVVVGLLPVLASIGAASGERTTGSFQANLTATGGGTKTITQGVFDVALVVSALAP